MTYKILSGYIQGAGLGYYLTTAFTYTGLSIATNGTVEGAAGVNAGQTPNDATAGFSGLLIKKDVPVVNSGHIVGGHGGSGGVPANPGVTIGTPGYAGGAGVDFDAPGYLHNLATITGGGGGASGGGAALAGQGGEGVYANFVAATVANGGLIKGGAGSVGGMSTTGSGGGAAGVGSRGGAAVTLDDGGSVTNSGTVAGGDGGAGGLATVGVGGRGGAGGAGLFEDHGGTFTNFGAIYGGAGGHGGQGASGGGQGGYGGDGVEILSIAGALTNSGLIAAGKGGAGGSGSPSGSAGQAGFGVYLTATGASVINATETATIVGGVGVKTRAAYVNTITNYGTIQGTTGVAVLFQNAADRLIDEPGSFIFGTAVGGGGTLELAPGYGTISGMGLPSAATFAGFGFYVVDSGGNWTIAGDNDVPLGKTLSSAGVLDLTGTLTNYGAVTGSNSYLLTVTATGKLVNIAGGVIDGASEDGLVIAGSVLNYGSITGASSGVALQTGGRLSNRGVIDGATGVAGFGAGTLYNYGSVGGAGQAAAEFVGGGALLNVVGAVISGADDGFIGLGVSATNQGTIRSLGGANYGGFLVGNSVATNTASGVMEGYSGVVLASSTLTNSGLIDGYGYAGVYANTAGSGASYLTNKAGGIIEGAKYGVFGKGSVTVTNFGVIDGTSGTAVAFGATGGRLIVEAGSTLTGAAVGGGGTLEFADGGGGFTLTAAGATGGGISVASSGFAIYRLDVGSWTVTAASSIAAGQSVLDQGSLSLSGTIGNAGTLEAGKGGVISVNGVVMGTGAVSALDTAAGGVIDIGNGASAQIQGSLANAGTIAPMSAGNKSDLRILAGGATLSGGGTVSLSGSKARILGATASATLTNVDNTIVGVGSIGGADMTLINQASGVIEATGLLTVRDAAGHSLANFGLMEANATGKLALVSETINQSGGGKILAAGGLITLQGVDFLGGTLTTTGAGRINVDGGGATLDGSSGAVTNAGLLQVTGGETLTVEGSLINSGKLDLHAAKLLVTAAGVTLSGAGQVNLNDSASNIIVGATAGATLTNTNDRIAGSGDIGDGSMVLVNNAAGQIIGNQGVALTLDTGTATITNAGLIENSGKGGTLVKSAVNNTGTLKAVTAGTLTLQGTVTGAGVAQINGGVLYVQQAFAETVTFTGATGVLKLGDSQAYTGKVSGLSKTGTNALDLVDIAFSNTKTKASYSGTTASGVLTVTDGTHTAKIALVGDYLGSTFTVSTDGHTGTKVVDPAAGGGSPSSAAPLAQALASFQPGPPPHLAGTPAYHLPRFPIFHVRA